MEQFSKYDKLACILGIAGAAGMMAVSLALSAWHVNEEPAPMPSPDPCATAPNPWQCNWEIGKKNLPLPH